MNKDTHPVMARFDAIAGMKDRKIAGALRDALLADLAALGTPPNVIESMRRIMNNQAR